MIFNNLERNRKKFNELNWYKDGGPWDLVIGLRLYLILLFLVAPVVHLIVNLVYLQPIGLIILGFSIWLIIRFVFFESRTDSEKLLKISLMILIPLAGTVFLNFSFGLIISIIHANQEVITIFIITVIASLVYFMTITVKRPFKTLNLKMSDFKLKWNSNRNHTKVRKHFFKVILLIWCIISAILIFIPYPIYFQSTKERTRDPSQKIGVWTYGEPLDKDRMGTDKFVTNETLEWLSEKGVYFVYGLKTNRIGEELYYKFSRLKKYNIETHVYIGTRANDVNFVNLWSFENLRVEIEEVLTYFKNNGFIGTPITTLVYDMEAISFAHFPDYGFNSTKIDKLSEYYQIQQLFEDFNNQIQEEYGLKIRICTDMYQIMDSKDYDDDIINLWGLMSDNEATYSYMIYRRDNLGMNYVLDCNRLANEGDTIILNSWKFEGYHCWENIKCAIDECRLVLGYPDKLLHLEIWALWYFLKSYGMDGFIHLIDAITTEMSQWQDIMVCNQYPYSPFSDLIITGTSLLDWYGPLFRLAYHAY